jgi:hypothetical protein
MLSSLEKITVPELTEFLDAIGAKPICPFCNCDTWHVLTDMSESGFVLITNKKWSAACGRCGFIRNHHVELFRQWRAQKNG